LHSGLLSELVHDCFRNHRRPSVRTRHAKSRGSEGGQRGSRNRTALGRPRRHSLLAGS
jgi:hypothetical protein